VKVIESQDKIWRFTEIYGEPRWEDKYKTWDKIREQKNVSNLPWLLMGDFNEILFSDEKEGGNPRPQHYMQAFRDTLTECGLEDIGYSGIDTPGNVAELESASIVVSQMALGSRCTQELFFHT
jgi:hypothetical protein